MIILYIIYSSFIFYKKYSRENNILLSSDDFGVLPEMNSREELFGLHSFENLILSEDLTSRVPVTSLAGASPMMPSYINPTIGQPEDSNKNEDFIEVVDKFRFKIDEKSTRLFHNKTFTKLSNPAASVLNHPKEMSDVSTTHDAASIENHIMEASQEINMKNFIFSSDLVEILNEAEIIDQGDSYVLRVNIDHFELENMISSTANRQLDQNEEVPDFRGLLGTPLSSSDKLQSNKISNKVIQNLDEEMELLLASNMVSSNYQNSVIDTKNNFFLSQNKPLDLLSKQENYIARDFIKEKLFGPRDSVSNQISQILPIKSISIKFGIENWLSEFVGITLVSLLIAGLDSLSDKSGILLLNWYMCHIFPWLATDTIVKHWFQTTFQVMKQQKIISIIGLFGLFVFTKRILSNFWLRLVDPYHDLESMLRPQKRRFLFF